MLAAETHKDPSVIRQRRERLVQGRVHLLGGALEELAAAWSRKLACVKMHSPAEVSTGVAVTYRHGRGCRR